MAFLHKMRYIPTSVQVIFCLISTEVPENGQVYESVKPRLWLHRAQFTRRLHGLKPTLLFLRDLGLGGAGTAALTNISRKFRGRT